MDNTKSESKYERLRKIGIGSYGVVFKCINRQTGQIVAIKRYSENDSDPVIRKIAMREVRMLRQLKHPNLINLIEVFRRKHRLHLVFDYCELTVLDVIEKYGNSCPLNLIKKITWQTVNGINYCHQRNCIHRDIKPENILINQYGLVKLCDFGFARNVSASRSNVSSLIMQTNKMRLNQRMHLAPEASGIEKENVNSSEINDTFMSKDNDRQAFTDYVATRWYRAPELLVGDIYYDVKIDIWAIGCVTAELIRGEPVWPGKTDLDQLCIIKSTLGPLTASQTQTLLNRAIYDQFNTERLLNQQMSSAETLDKKLPQRVGQCAVDFVKACLQMDPTKRPPSFELLCHKYISSVKIPQLISKEPNPLVPIGVSMDSQRSSPSRLAPKGVSLVPMSQHRLLTQAQHPPRANSQTLMLAAQSGMRPIPPISMPSKRPLVEAKLDSRQMPSKIQAPASHSSFATARVVNTKSVAVSDQKEYPRKQKQQQQVSVRNDESANNGRNSQAKIATSVSNVPYQPDPSKSTKKVHQDNVMRKSLLPVSKFSDSYRQVDTIGKLPTNKHKSGDRIRLGSDQSSGSSSVGFEASLRTNGAADNKQVDVNTVKGRPEASTVGDKSSVIGKPSEQTYRGFSKEKVKELDGQQVSTKTLVGSEDSPTLSALSSAGSAIKRTSISHLPSILDEQSKIRLDDRGIDSSGRGRRASSEKKDVSHDE